MPGVFSKPQVAVRRFLSSRSATEKKRLRSAALLGIGAIVVGYWWAKRNGPKRGEKELTAEQVQRRKRRQFDVDTLRSLLKIIMPEWKSKEMGLLAAHTSFLVARTFLSIYVTQLNGSIVKTIVERAWKDFFFALLKWIGIGVPATLTNSMIRYLENKLALSFRTRLSRYAYDLYMHNQAYYRVTNLDSRIPNVDQCLTEDVNKFCSHLAHLYSHISKPILDIVLMSAQLWRLADAKTGRGSAAPPLVTAVTIIYFTYRVLRFMSPPFGSYVAEQGKREGELRFVHSRLIINSEEVAFYGGQNIEKNILVQKYESLVKHMNFVYSKRVLYSWLEGFFMKYVWSGAGLLMVALPSLLTTEERLKKAGLESVSARTEAFVTSKGLLLNAAEAVERIMSAYSEVKELNGYMSRVSSMLAVLKDVQEGKYEKRTIGAPGHEDSPNASGEHKPSPERRLRAGDGELFESDMIKLEDVPVVTPNGDVLVDSLSVVIGRDDHCLITGPNGCGKSSVFRILGELWPVYGGRVYKPKVSKLFYVPQRPYLSIGTLRDQVIYPSTREEHEARGGTDADLDRLMEIVSMDSVIRREGGWDALNDWADVLSGGEKQRIGMVRLFYHRPIYAFLDECTSATSIDVEGRMYNYAKELGITLLTVTHRPSLWKYHTCLLQFDGAGGWLFSPLNADARLSLREEKDRLQEQLRDVPKVQRRLEELCEVLGETMDPLLAGALSSPNDEQTGGE